MAAVGIGLKRLLRKRTLTGMAHAYVYAGLIGSGPWVISIVAILAIGIITGTQPDRSVFVNEFQVSVCYLIAGSLLLTSPLQLMFTRYAADRAFENRHHLILPNLLGALTFTIVSAAVVGVLALTFWIEGSFVYRLCMLVSFIVLSCLWIVQIGASVLRAFGQILCVFVLGYTLTAATAISLNQYGLDGLMLGFAISQSILLLTLLTLVVRQCPGEALVMFSFLRRDQIYPILALTGMLYILGMWADKFVFWWDDITGVAVVGLLRTSPVYDLPIFLAYLSVIPGMTVWLVQMENNIVERCADFFHKVSAGSTLQQVVDAKQVLVDGIKSGLLTMFKVQLLITLVLLILADDLLELLGISPLYRPLLSIDLVAVTAQLVVLCVMNILTHLDYRKGVCGICLLFFVANTVFTLLSMDAGPEFYGYGFAAAVLLTMVVSLIMLSRTLDRLEYTTFMLQPA